MRSAEAGGTGYGPGALESGREADAPGLARDLATGLRSDDGSPHDGGTVVAAGDDEDGGAGAQLGSAGEGIGAVVSATLGLRDRDAVGVEPEERVGPREVAGHLGNPLTKGVVVILMDHEATLVNTFRSQ